MDLSSAAEAPMPYPELPWLNDIEMIEILNLIDTCVVLHNFILSHNENTDEPFFYSPKKEVQIRDLVGPLPDDDEINLLLPDVAPRGLRREQLRAYLSEHNLI